MSVDLAHIRQVMAEADCLYTEEQVEAAITKVAETINGELADRNPVVFCVMNGGLIFSGKLVPKLNFPLELSYLHATRYRNETSGGELFWKAKPEISFIDRDVLITQLDVARKLVEIDAIILDIERTQLREFGVNWGFQNSRFQGGVNNLNGASSQLQLRDRFYADIRALEARGLATMVSNPSSWAPTI